MPHSSNFEVNDYLFPLVANAAVMDMFITDINGDGYDDVILTYFFFPMEDRSIPLTLLFGSADGSLTPADASFFVGGVPENVWGRQIVVADFNEDGRPDIYIADHGFDAPPFPGAQNSLLLSTADGQHMVNATANLPQLTDFTHSAAVGYFNGDAHLDIFVNNYNGDGTESTYILLGDGLGGFTQNFALPADIVAGNYNSPASGVIDFDGDGDLDIVMTPNFTNEQDIRILINDGQGNFSGPSAYLDVAPIGIQDGVVDLVVADINGDGMEDMVLSIAADNYASQGYISIFINHGNGIFVDETASRVSSSDSPTWIQRNQLIDVNGDGHLDIVQLQAGDPASGNILLNNGEGVFIRLPSDFSEGHDRFTGAYEYDRLLGGDIDNDGRTDLVALRFHDGENFWTAVHRGVDPGSTQVGDEHANGIVGDASDEVLAGGAGNDVIFGGGGADRLLGEAGNDTLVGGDGIDVVDYSTAKTGVRVDLIAQSAIGEGADIVMSVENVIGSAYRDALIGDAASNVLEGRGGEDSLYGNAGDDTLMGGTRADELFGGVGNDHLLGEAGNDRVNGGSGNDWIEGGVDDDLLVGGPDSDRISGGAGNDTIVGGSGSDTADYGGAGAEIVANLALGTAIGEGSDTLIGIENLIGSAFGDNLAGDSGANTIFGLGGEDSLKGGPGDDMLSGGSRADEIYGGVGDDWLLGDGGNDRINGGSGNDTIEGGTNDDLLIGGPGDDIILGGSGNDRMGGGSGDDTFVFDAGFGADVIDGFVAGGTEDHLDFTALGIGYADLSIIQQGSDTLISTPDGSSVLLAGVLASSLDAGVDFAF